MNLKTPYARIFTKPNTSRKGERNTHSLNNLSVNFRGDHSLLSHSLYSIIGLEVTQNSPTRAKVGTSLEGNIG